MKKLLVVILIAITGLAGFDYWQKNKSNFPQLKVLSGADVLESIQKQILTSGPLRSAVSNPSANLTLKGVIAQTNLQRQEEGLLALAENSKLNAAAAAKVKDMFTRQYFEHTSPDGKGPSDLAKAAGYDYIMVGENLALGNYKDDQALVDAWMNSPGHRANILNGKFTQIGVAVGKGTFEGKTTWLAVQEFGKPSSDCPAASTALKAQIDISTSEINSLQTQVLQLKAELNQMDSNSRNKEEINYYNQKVGEYNDLVKIYNNRIDSLKNLINLYNFEVKNYNACLSA